MSSPHLRHAGRVGTTLSLILAASISFLAAQDVPESPSEAGSRKARAPSLADRGSRWRNGPPTSDDYFPIAVWLQHPRNAARYKALGINLYVGLWKGPTREQLEALARHDMPVICAQNRFARNHLEDAITEIIVGWMHGDEPDNAQSLGRGKGYGPPVDPAKIIADYKELRDVDATRPILLNLGQGVAWDGWHGRGVRTNHPEDYPWYLQGCDIACFDIYPVVHDRPAVRGKLWYVPRGIKRLREWTKGEKLVWNCIECTHIGNAEVKPTPRQVKAEVWMAIIHGSRGLIYFCHQFEPRFIEAGLLADEEMAGAVGAINRQIHELAPAINGKTVSDGLTVEVNPDEVSSEMARKLHSRPIATLVTKHDGALYIFAVRMEASPVAATFRMEGLPGEATVTVLGEDRTVAAHDGEFVDAFEPHAVHLYRVEGARE